MSRLVSFVVAISSMATPSFSGGSSTALNASDKEIACHDSTASGDEVGSNGWSRFVKSKDARVIYVSSSEGKDSNLGLRIERPVRTLQRGYDRLRSGYPDWLLLKRGDVWIDERFTDNWKKSGRSETEPMLISAYGEDGARPRILTPANLSALQSAGDHGQAHIAFVGLHFEPYKRSVDDNPTGVRWLGVGEDLLFEDVYIAGFGNNLTIQEYQGNRVRDLRIRRSIIVDSWSGSGHSQGLFAKGVDGLLIEENVFDHNGWNENVKSANPTKFNHNLYIQISTKGLVARGNVIARGAAAGLQARSGGVVEDNLFVANPISLMWGWVKGPQDPAGVGGRVKGNVILDCVDRDYGSWGIAVGNIGAAFDAVIANNIVANCTARGATALIVAGNNGFGIHGLDVRGNVFTGVTHPLRVLGRPGEELKEVVFSRNTFRDSENSPGVLIQFRDARVGHEAIRFSGNRYFKETGGNAWFRDRRGAYDPEEWVSAAPEPDAEFGPSPREKSEDLVKRYITEIDGGVTLRDFLAVVRHRSPMNWCPAYTATAVNRFVSRWVEDGKE